MAGILLGMTIGLSVGLIWQAVHHRKVCRGLRGSLEFAWSQTDSMCRIIDEMRGKRSNG